MKLKLNSLAWMSVMLGGNQAPVITWPVPSLQWTILVAASYCECINVQQCSEHSGPRTGQRLIFHQDNDLDHTAKLIKEWPQSGPLCECLLPDQTSLERSENSCVLTIPTITCWSLRSFVKKTEKLPKNRCTELVESYSKTFKAATAAKGGSTTAVNTYVHVLGFFVICLFY